MDTSLYPQKKYASLLSDIRKIIQQGRDNTVKAVNQELVLTYWQVGERICRDNIDKDSSLLSPLLEDAAEELLIDTTTLLRCVQLFNVYPDGVGETSLNWSQYKLLLPMNEEKREWYEAQAVENNWDVRKLNQAIRSNKFETGKAKRSSKKAVTTIKRPLEATYVYKAIVENVVDGDTLLVRIDLGFTTWKEQRLRLASIDTPALDEPGGVEASDFVEKQLSACEFVMIKTNKIDIYGRYVAHIFYMKGEKDKVKVFEKGNYLNQELLDRGLAIVF